MKEKNPKRHLILAIAFILAAIFFAVIFILDILKGGYAEDVLVMDAISVVLPVTGAIYSFKAYHKDKKNEQ